MSAEENESISAPEEGASGKVARGALQVVGGAVPLVGGVFAVSYHAILSRFEAV